MTSIIPIQLKKLFNVEEARKRNLLSQYETAVKEGMKGYDCEAYDTWCTQSVCGFLLVVMSDQIWGSITLTDNAFWEENSVLEYSNT